MPEIASVLEQSPINFNDPLPYYVQVKNRLRESIADGTLRQGDQLPGEPTLCRIFSVSRTVIRQALAELELEGLVSRKKGIGTFIARPHAIERLSANLTGFYRDMKIRGLTPFTRVLHQEIVPADQQVAQQLQLQPGAAVVRLHRLRFVNHEPIVLTDTYLPGVLVPGLENVDFSRISLYQWLEQEYGLVLARGHRIIGAASASTYQADLFHIQPGDPLIVIQNTTCTADGTPVEYYTGLYRGDRNIFEVEMIRQR
ncbi:MAG: GntR family transcriptional regulator [Anaerolineae bacterium]|nr:GntR family transcriptional regulator [Anaerolineae bacterium]